MFWKFILSLGFICGGVILVSLNEPLNPTISEWHNIGFMMLGASSTLTCQFIWKYWR